MGITINNNSNNLFNILLFVFLESKLKNTDINIIPIIPPRVFMIISVISETPMWSIYCSSSKLRDKRIIIKTFENLLFLKINFRYIPNGTNNSKLISASFMPLTIGLALKGIRLIERIYFRPVISRRNLKTIIQITICFTKYFYNSTSIKTDWYN